MIKFRRYYIRSEEARQGHVRPPRRDRARGSEVEALQIQATLQYTLHGFFPPLDLISPKGYLWYDVQCFGIPIDR